MLWQLTRLFAVLALNVVSAAAWSSSRNACSEIVEFLGFSLSDYRFEERGLFSMERHHFGNLTCFVDGTGKFDSLYLGERAIAEDGYFGEDALNQRDKLVAEFNSEVKAAKDTRKAEIEAAREKFRQTEAALTERREVALQALRETSRPPTSRQPETNEGTANEGAALEATSDSERLSHRVTEEKDRGGLVQQRMFVIAGRLSRRTCPSTSCGISGSLKFREAVLVFETQDGWARITQPYSASCKDGFSEYVKSGDARCEEGNGIVRGIFAEWVSLQHLSKNRPADPADSAFDDEAIIAHSDDFRSHRRVFSKAAQDLIDQGRCTKSDFMEWGDGQAHLPKAKTSTLFIVERPISTIVSI